MEPRSGVINVWVCNSTTSLFRKTSLTGGQYQQQQPHLIIPNGSVTILKYWQNMTGKVTINTHIFSIFFTQENCSCATHNIATKKKIKVKASIAHLWYSMMGSESKAIMAYYKLTIIFELIINYRNYNSLCVHCILNYIDYHLRRINVCNTHIH